MEPIIKLDSKGIGYTSMAGFGVKDTLIIHGEANFHINSRTEIPELPFYVIYKFEL